MYLVRGGALTALALIIALGCGSSESTAGPGGTSGGSSGPGTGPGESPPAPAPPAVGGKPVEGVFVSASMGIEGADGSINRPVKTLAAAMPIAAQKRLPIIACAETYNESVELVDGVTMYGYFDCSAEGDWKRVKAHAKIESPTSPAVLGEGLTLLARIEGFDVSGPDIAGAAAGGTAAASSYGMVIRSSRNLTLADVVIRAGKGQDGADGIDPTDNNVELSSAVVAKGKDSRQQKVCLADPGTGVSCGAQTAAGGPGGVSQCKVGSPGGPGGSGGLAPVSDSGSYRQVVVDNYSPLVNKPYAQGHPVVATLETAAGGRTGTVGLNPGADGGTGGPGALGTHGVWSFTDDGFVPGDGKAGGVGLPGQGGGGGAGASVMWASETAAYSPPPLQGIYYGASGGGGGAGGCGGLPGSAGSGGGASIGLFLVNSTAVSISDSRIEGKKGGHSGKGATGLPGIAGAPGGQGKRAGGIFGAAGGVGGSGGPAGLSGHGAPGPSIALVYNGTAPKTANVDLTAGSAGDGFPERTEGSQTLPAVLGIAKTEHSF